MGAPDNLNPNSSPDPDPSPSPTPNQVHVFPTGKRDPDSRSLGPLKAGVGKIIASCEQTPVVVPFYHYGMERIQCKARGEVLPIT